MKLVLAIVNNDDSRDVNTALCDSGISVTKISSTGGFLMNGNSTFLAVVDDRDVEKTIDIIGKHSRKREQNIPIQSTQQGLFPVETGKVTVGGATVFVLNVEDCRRM